MNQYISLKMDALEKLSRARLKAKDASNEIERAEALTLYDQAIERLQEFSATRQTKPDFARGPKTVMNL